MDAEQHASGAMQRVVVVGSSCAGKTTLARSLSQCLHSTHIQLDALHWLPDWVEREPAEFRALVGEAVSAERWIVDGNYSRVRDLTWSRATDLIWLDYSFARVGSQALRRTFRRSWTGEELYSGNRESLRRALFSHDSILLWVLTSFRRRRRQIGAALRAPEFAHLRVHHMRGRAQTEELLRGFARGVGDG